MPDGGEVGQEQSGALSFRIQHIPESVAALRLVAFASVDIPGGGSMDVLAAPAH
jgi:hypothetical protein